MTLVWIAGFAGLLVWLVAATRAAREQPGRVVPRTAAVLAALGVAVLGFSSAYIWGVSVAEDGMARIHSSDQQGTVEYNTAEPPRARLFLRHVQLQLSAPAETPESAHQAIVGYSPEASLRLPRGYGLAEAKQGWDLVRAQAIGPQGLRVETIERAESTDTRVFLHARRRAIGTWPSPTSIARAAASMTGRGPARCRSRKDAGAPGVAELDGPGALYVILCRGRTPVVSLVLERDLLAADIDSIYTPIRVTPLVWRGGRWRPHHVQISSGSLIQIGTMADALPGVTLWEVPAPSGRAELFFPPDDLLASCPEWLSGQKRRGFFSYPGHVSTPTGDQSGLVQTPAESHHEDSICVLPFTPPFGLEVRRLLPDVPGIGARSLWAAGLLTTPALLLLLLLCTRPRSQLTRLRFRRILTLGWLASLLAAVAVWRLLWAHRIDMLRDYESVGTRVLQNQLVAVLLAATLAATCVLAWWHRRTGWRTALAAIGAWSVWLAVGGYALRADLATIEVSGRLLGQVVLSLLVATALFWAPHVGAIGHRLWHAVLQRADMARETRTWLAAMAALAVVTVVALLAGSLAPRAVVLKLTLAWSFVLALYAALRTSLGHGSADQASGNRTSLRALCAIALGVIGAGFLARFDPGVSVAIAGPGLLAALLFASHDARFADSSLQLMAGYRRHHAPLVLAHAALMCALALFVAVASLYGLWSSGAREADAMLSRSLTLGAIHLLLFFALLFAAAGALAYLRRGLRAAVPWLLIAVTLSGAWLARGAIIDRVLSSSTQAANRIAIVLDPGYALLRSETKFSSGITAWRETIMPAQQGTLDSGDLLAGQGYFGAQLIDPGVLLSIENDYFPVLLLREAGIHGILATGLLLLVLVAGMWVLSGSRFRHGSSGQRARALASVVLGILCVYQPLAALGVLPLTGISWPGFGLDSPSDVWVLMTLVLWVLLWGQPETDDDPALEEFDRELRGSRLFRRVHAAVATTAAVAVLAGLLLSARAGAFALRRPNPVDPQGRAVKPFDGLEKAVDYAFHLQCPWRQKSVDTEAGDLQSWARELVPDDLLGDASSGGVFRFHSSLRAAWQRHRKRAIAEVAGFLDGRATCGAKGLQRAGPWSFQRSPEDENECLMRFKVGWPEVELSIERDGAGAPTTDSSPAGADEDRDKGGSSGDDQASTDDEPAVQSRIHSARCGVDVRTDIVRTLHFPARRPYRNARIRLVSRAMGDAARDLGELLSGHLAVRLRPGAGEVDVAQARAGLYFADQVHISRDLTIAREGDGIVLRRRAAPKADGEANEQEAWLLLRDPPGGEASQVQVLEADEGTWKLLPPEDKVPLTRMALLVIGGPDARSLWLFRPPSSWPGEADAVSPLIADDITTVRGERRRHYLFGGLVPEIGWVNPYHSRMSVGLDGWVRVAMSEYEKRSPNAPRPRTPAWLDGGDQVPYCGTLDVRTPVASGSRPAGKPPTAGGRPAGSGGAGGAGGANGPGDTERPALLDPALARVCQHSPLDGVLECRVSVQPELSIRLRHLTELLSTSPREFSADKEAVAAVKANFALLRGDTGEIVAQGEFVPGRASLAYAPATPEIEQYLIRLREDRDPRTGRKLRSRGESSAEKVDWSQPVAIGSTMKPLLGRAMELADPDFARNLVAEGSKVAGAYCRRMKVHAIFGHCPPTDSLWNRSGFTDMNRFLATSVNWYQAAIGLLGTAASQRGSFGFGQVPEELDLTTITGKNVGDHRVDAALWTRYRGKPVIEANRTLRTDNLRKTPLWRQFEAVVGRPLCMLRSKNVCRKKSARKDLCAARALPIDKPTNDLRHLVALGPSTFDFYPRLADPSKRVGPSVNTREYLQFLRGSGLHPLGSLAQLSDAFNRVVFQYQRDRQNPSGYQLAASWFPTDGVGKAPPWTCSEPVTGRDIAAGLCEVVRTGTARTTIGPLLQDQRFVIYGAKTGTIDSLADIAEQKEACAHFATGHTVPDLPADAKSQPYWLPCTKKRKRLVAVNDSLFVVSFAIVDGEQTIPLTLGLRFQRSGPGFAARVAGHYLEVIHDYFASAERDATATESATTAPTTP